MTALTEQSSTARSYTGEADLQAIVDLINACDAVDQLERATSVEELRLRFADPDFDAARDIQLWESQGQLIGYGWMWLPPAGETQDCFLGFNVHPNFRGNRVEDQIIAWAEERLQDIHRATHRSGTLRSGAREGQTDRIALLEQHGFTISRYFYRMARPLTEPLPAPQLPAGYKVRSLQPDQVAAWVDMFNQTFIDHWNFYPLTIEQRQHWMTDPDYAAELDLVAIAPNGTFAAFCLGFIRSQDNARTGRNEGWIADLGTRRGFRKLGLGRAMLLTGMQQLNAKGVDTALLGVDAENPSGALHLYQSVGFSQLFTNIAYCKQISCYRHLN